MAVVLTLATRLQTWPYKRLMLRNPSWWYFLAFMLHDDTSLMIPDRLVTMTDWRAIWIQTRTCAGSGSRPALRPI
jgi:hypothetical protein